MTIMTFINIYLPILKPNSQVRKFEATKQGFLMKDPYISVLFLVSHNLLNQG